VFSFSLTDTETTKAVAVQESASLKQFDGREILSGSRTTDYVVKLAERHYRSPEAATQ